MKSAASLATALIVVVGLVARVGAQGGEVAEGKFINAQGKKIGTVHVEHMPSATIFFLDLHNLPPGVHGIHIHSVGKCDPPDFASAGPHFNPSNAKHGMKNPQGPHAGDLPNITIPKSGKLQTQIMVAGDRQWSGEGGILDGDGASLVIHASADDYMTDPSGNSGARIACAKLDLPERQN
jgi:superoxide dismutase, Cu-Zn family